MAEQLVHATCVALEGPSGPRGVLLRGPSGAGKSDLALRLIDEGARLVARETSRLRIALEPGLAARRLESRAADLEAVCERFFGRPMAVVFEVGGDAGADRSTAPAPGDDERARRRRKEALDHPAVNAALEILEGDILEIRPLGDAG